MHACMRTYFWLALFALTLCRACISSSFSFCNFSISASISLLWCCGRGGSGFCGVWLDVGVVVWQVWLDVGVMSGVVDVNAICEDYVVLAALLNTKATSQSYETLLLPCNKQHLHPTHKKKTQKPTSHTNPHIYTSTHKLIHKYTQAHISSHNLVVFLHLEHLLVIAQHLGGQFLLLHQHGVQVLQFPVQLGLSLYVISSQLFVQLL